MIFFPHLTFLYSSGAKAVISRSFGEPVAMLEQRFSILGNIYLVDFFGKYPSSLFTVSTGAVCLLVLILNQKLRRIPRSVSYYFAFVFFITLVSSVFFYFMPDNFPYGVRNFSDLYIKTEIGIWLLLPVIMSISLAPLPSSIFEKFLITLSALAYSMVFGFVRYIIFLYILKKFSYIFMPTMFIAFDPPLDTIYFVGIYSWYASRISQRINGRLSVWSCS